MNERSNGGVIENIRRLRDESVQHARGKIEELFGMGTYDDTKQMEIQLSKGSTTTRTDGAGNTII